MARSGNRGGFNPYRDKNGRFSAPSGGGGAEINAAIRQAAGRGTGGTSRPGGGSGGSGGSGGGTTAAGSSGGDHTKISAANRKKITDAFADIDPGAFEDNPKHDPIAAALSNRGGQGGVNTIANSLLQHSSARGPGTRSPERTKLITDALLGAYADAGIKPPTKIAPREMLAIYDGVSKAHSDAQLGKGSWDDWEKATAHGIAAALRFGDVDMATTIADGPSGAGIGWGLTRQALREEHGLPDDGRDA